MNDTTKPFEPNPFTLTLSRPVDSLSDQGVIQLDHGYFGTRSLARKVFNSDEYLLKNIVGVLTQLKFVPFNIVEIADSYAYVLLDALLAISIPKDPDSGVCAFFVANTLEELLSKCVSVTTDNKITLTPDTVFIGKSLGDLSFETGKNINEALGTEFFNNVDMSLLKAFLYNTLEQHNEYRGFWNIATGIGLSNSPEPLEQAGQSVIHDKSPLSNLAVTNVKVVCKRPEPHEIHIVDLHENEPNKFHLLKEVDKDLYLHGISVIGPFADKKPITIYDGKGREVISLETEVEVSFSIECNDTRVTYNGRVCMVYSEALGCVVVTKRELIEPTQFGQCDLMIDKIQVSAK